ncbi:MAG: 2Fe-2S iron-sulfur cluster-binding protein [Candidatus Moduliflexus flocculans]|nr:2Fe-2S iron-sulfur cluster-binding protein [Candidatus Moduliflexus flocculans]
MSEIQFTIDGKACVAKPGQTIVEAAKDNGVWIPVLCHYEGLKPVGSCRICTVRVAGRYMAACTQPVTEGMAVENDVPDLEDMRKALVEMLFVEGNHFCPSCEKSGNCELQALGLPLPDADVPRFPYLWPGREIDAAAPLLMLERNRCIQCLRCVRAVKAKDGRKVFAAVGRGPRVTIEADREAGREALRGGGPQGHGHLPGRGHPEEGDRLRRPDRQAQVRPRPHRQRRRERDREVGP